MIIGYLGKDPEVRMSQSGIKFANFSVATTDKWTDKNGVKQEKTEWHKITSIGKLSDIIEKYLKKGNKVYVEGKLQTRKWQDKDGSDKYSTEVIAENLTMLDSKQQEGEVKQETQTANVEPPPFDDVIPF